MPALDLESSRIDKNDWFGQVVGFSHDLGRSAGAARGCTVPDRNHYIGFLYGGETAFQVANIMSSRRRKRVDPGRLAQQLGGPGPVRFGEVFFEILFRSRQ